MHRDLIFDVGVHLAEDTEFYAKKGFRVVGVEAHPGLYQKAAERLRDHIAKGRVTLLKVAVAERDGPITFYENTDQSVWGTTSREWMERNSRLGAQSNTIEVTGVRFASILSDHGIPYYLKIDVEGADRLCLEALMEFETRPKYLSLESEKVSWRALRDEFNLLARLGYTRFKVVNQQEVPSQRCPNPAREGAYVEHRFEMGASGLFGEETPGDWIDLPAAIAEYRRIFWRYRWYGDDGLLKRFRLGRALIRRYRLRSGWYDTHAAL